MATEYKLPSILTRKPEVDAIAELLENGKHKDARAAAKAVLAASFNLMAARDWYVVASRIDSNAPPVFYGMFATENAALKALSANSLGLFGEASVYEVRGLRVRADEIAKWESQVKLGCVYCGHMEEAHDWPRSKVRGCVVAHCGCKTYERPASDIPDVEVA